MAQPINNLVKDVVMPAPNAAALGKYGDIPVSYFTGVPNIAVPIHAIQEGSLSLPITLSYHASGIKVAETASWVGMGWSLSAGGMITRTVLGKPDDNAGYYTNGSQVTLSLQNVENVVAGLMDSEPDIFNFNVNGYNGKFYFDKNKVPHVVPKQDIKIIPTHVGSEFTSFTLIVPDGTRYIFGQVGEIKARERTTVYSDPDSGSQPEPYISSWYLLKVETFDKNYAINLTYEDEHYSFANKASNSKTKVFCSATNGGGTQENISLGGIDGLIYTNIQGNRLKTISTPSTTITFNALTDRTDLDNAYSIPSVAIKKRLDNIAINANGKQSNWAFTYSHFLDTTTATPPSHGKRLKLESVRESAGSDIKPPYTYDANGNLTSDLNKNIAEIKYNYLNLPMLIRFAEVGSFVYTIEFVYDATGVKLKKIVKVATSTQVYSNVVYDYINGVEYQSDVLQRIAHTEGSVSKNENGAYEHQYVLRDHLGNTRVTFRDGINKGDPYMDWNTWQYIDPNAGNTTGLNDGVITSADIMQVNHYYPFGLNMEGNWQGGAGGQNKYQYNEKELNQEFGLDWNDYGFRMYDPAIGRWWAIDAMSERRVNLSPYQYVQNNPVRLIDILGLTDYDPSTDPNLIKGEVVVTAKRLAQRSQTSNEASKQKNLKGGLYTLSRLQGPYSSLIAIGVKGNADLLELAADVPSENAGGSEGQHNAFRHFYGMALLAQLLGPKTSAELGNAHELDATISAEDLLNSPLDYDKFDSFVDQKNNEIARNYASSTGKGKSNLDVALDALDLVKNGGLLMVVQNNDKSNSVAKTSLSPEGYQRARINIINHFQKRDIDAKQLNNLKNKSHGFDKF